MGKQFIWMLRWTIHWRYRPASTSTLSATIVHNRTCGSPCQPIIMITMNVWVKTGFHQERLNDIDALDADPNEPFFIPEVHRQSYFPSVQNAHCFHSFKEGRSFRGGQILLNIPVAESLPARNSKAFSTKTSGRKTWKWWITICFTGESQRENKVQHSFLISIRGTSWGAIPYYGVYGKGTTLDSYSLLIQA